MKLCDLTQFYSPTSGGVKRYVSEKARYVRKHTGDEHVLIIPGECDAVEAGVRTRIYTIASPLVSRTSQYRILLRLEAIERIVERERPDLIESGDPYQVGWRAARMGRAFGIPVVAFYHSHFVEAYVRTVEKAVGAKAAEWCVGLSQRYVRALYNRFDRTLVPSPALGAVLAGWGVRNVTATDLGVDTTVFHPHREPGEDLRAELGIPGDRLLLLYVGRLAQEKNTHTLFAAFALLPRDRFHLLVVGDGLQRAELGQLFTTHGAQFTHLPYCAEATRLAQLYRAADLFVHPGVQETFGLVTLEAQACGTPVVGIRGSYMDAIVQSDQSFWAPGNSPAALASAIENSIRADSNAAAEELHRRVAARYSWTQVFARLFGIYHEVLSRFPQTNQSPTSHDRSPL